MRADTAAYNSGVTEQGGMALTGALHTARLAPLSEAHRDAMDDCCT